MKISFLLLAATLFGITTGASAQSFTSSDQLLGSTADPTPLVVGNRPYTQKVTGGGSITYFNTEQTHQPQHEQFARLRQAFATNKPTVVVYEYPDMGSDSTETATISNLGTAGYVRYLDDLGDPVVWTTVVVYGLICAASAFVGHRRTAPTATTSASTAP